MRIMHLLYISYYPLYVVKSRKRGIWGTGEEGLIGKMDTWGREREKNRTRQRCGEESGREEGGRCRK
jgi:hypothetical protein